MKGQEIARWNQYGVGDTGSSVRGQIHDIHELIEEPATIELNCNK